MNIPIVTLPARAAVETPSKDVWSRLNRGASTHDLLDPSTTHVVYEGVVLLVADYATTLHGRLK